MPKLNELKLGWQIFKSPDAMRFIWVACEQCGARRWVPYIKCRNEPKSKVCWDCARRLEKGTKGKGHSDKDGYIVVSLPWEHQYIQTANARGWIYEHRLVMAQHLGRDLDKSEVVHHLNGNKKDNRIENLELMGRENHLNKHQGKPYIQRIQTLERTVKGLVARIKILESETSQAEFTSAEGSLKKR